MKPGETLGWPTDAEHGAAETSCAPAAGSTQTISSDATATLEFEPPPTIWLLDEPNCAAYDEFIAGHPLGSAYHTLTWRSALVRAGFGQSLYLAAMQGEQIVGVLPLIETQEPDGRRYLLSLPATPAAGTLADSEAVQWLLESRAVTLAELRGAEDVLARVFRPFDASEVALPEQAWLRVPISALLAQSPTETDETPRHCRVATSRFDARRCRSSMEEASDWLDRLFAAWPSDASGPLHVIELDATGSVRAGAVWLLAERDVHVLAWRPAGLDSQSALRLLRHVARYGAERGARRIDFPTHGLRTDVPRLLSLSPSIEVSTEQPLLMVTS